jgi:hypothetical protein
MTLSDRLEQARIRRLIERGVLPHDHAAPNGSDGQTLEAEEPPVLFDPITIEVPPTGLAIVATAPEVTELEDGEATPNCPNCNAVGRLDMVDLVGHTRHFTCERCGTMWQVRGALSESATP